MRQKLLRAGANELSYEIRGIVKKTRQIQALGQKIYWENIGDPVQKNAKIPQWIKQIIIDLIEQDHTFSYCDSKGVLETRQFLAQLNNARNGVQITSEDILFFNGLGDAISRIYQFILPTSRVIGPSPAYSTHSSAEAAHANDQPLTYHLDPANFWLPDIQDLYNKVKYNPNVVAILVINPDNPTGMVYPREILKQIVDIARTFKLFIVCDEIYMHITYNNAIAHPLSTLIGEVPGISLKGISKELPWPGARCGWAEYYNRQADKEFDRLCETLDNAKMMEVCATKLPQLVIPKIMQDKRYDPYLAQKNKAISKRSKVITSLLKDIPALRFNETCGAFYNTIIFKENILNHRQSLTISNKKIEKCLHEWLDNEENIALDKRFVYYLLAAKGVCVVPVSSFCSDLLGFRVTLLEEDENLLQETFMAIREAVIEYVA